MVKKKRWLAFMMSCFLIISGSNTSNMIVLAADNSESGNTCSVDTESEESGSTENTDDSNANRSDAQEDEQTNDENGDIQSGNSDAAQEEDVQSEDNQENMTGKASASKDDVIQKAASSSVSFNGLNVTADDGEDLTYGTSAGNYEIYSANSILYINTDREITISGSTTTAALSIAMGVHANVTFDGVTIAYASAPALDMVPNTSAATDEERTWLHLTLADGSSNSLTTSNSNYAGVHVSWGAILTIDDATTNWGEVYCGRIVGDKDENGVEKPSWYMDSDNAGSLYAHGGKNGAGIGGNTGENTGRIIINGGNITGSAESGSGGAGIGGGYSGGSGCLLDGGGIIINGGNINATASYHGAAIGTGYDCATAGVGHNGRVTGDITVNGGYVYAKGMEHGNALGGACNSQYKDNVGHGNSTTAHQIVITGGTLIPIRSSSSDWTYQVGAVGGDTIILGGSFALKERSGTSTGYDISGATIKGSDSSDSDNQLVLAKIAIGAMEDVEVGDRIYDFTVTIDGKPLEVDYGLPNRVTDDETLYFWLPSSAIGKSINISDVTVVKSDGTKRKALYPFSLPELAVGEDNVTKRWVTFDVDTDKFSEKLTNYLYKRYDGLGWDMDILAQEIVDQKIEVPEPAGVVIDEEDQLEFTSVRLKDWFGNATSDSSTKGQISTTGTYKITANYNKYKNDAKFGESYWGHQTTLTSVISPADSRIVNLDAVCTWQDSAHSKFKSMTITADVLPAEGEATTCEAPDGQVQFYINGVRVGDPVDVTADTSTTVSKSAGSAKVARFKDAQSDSGDEELTDNETVEYGDYAHSKATLTIDFSTEQSKYPIPESQDGTFVVEAQYLGGTNYALAEKRATITEEDAPDEFPFVTPPAAATDEDKTNVIIPETYDIEDGEDGSVILHGYASDVITTSVSSTPKTITSDEFLEMFKSRYEFFNPKSDGTVITEIESFELQDEDGNAVDEVELSKAGNYVIVATVYDQSSNCKTTLSVNYDIVKINMDTNGDGKPDANVDIDGDGIPDVNVDTDGDDIPDINIVDRDYNGKPDSIDLDDANQDKTPNVNIVDIDHDGKPDSLKDHWGKDMDTVYPTTNVDTDKDGIPDVNIDTDKDNIPDVDIVDKDGDGKPDAIDANNPDQDKTPNINLVDSNYDGKLDDLDPEWPDYKSVKPTVNIDSDGDGKPDTNVDTDGDGIPDVNIDHDGDGKADLDIVDKDGDGKPDNIDPNDKNQDKTPNVNIVDKDRDGKADDLDSLWPTEIKSITPDVNVDNDGNGIPDTNVDTDNDGKADVNIDKDEDGTPDLNIVDKDGDGKPDNINLQDPDQDTTPDVNIVDKDGDGKPDDLDKLTADEIKKLTPDVNVDTDGDGKPDVNIDSDGDGIPDTKLDRDGNGIPDDEEQTQKKSSEKKTTNNKAVKNKAVGKNVATGDNTPVVCWMLLMAVCVCVCEFVVKRRKKYIDKQ